MSVGDGQSGSYQASMYNNRFNLNTWLITLRAFVIYSVLKPGLLA